MIPTVKRLLSLKLEATAGRESHVELGVIDSQYGSVYALTLAGYYLLVS